MWTSHVYNYIEVYNFSNKKYTFASPITFCHSKSVILFTHSASSCIIITVEITFLSILVVIIIVQYVDDIEINKDVNRQKL